ncbi:hypothetical protein D9757_010051 [Collybiopsis confluens]|uniref:non-specific serine/threonine protein kinase n=1 Tax=Collybiopsis confluens TaxID=2823264 RepID=A0A8H5GZM5_9AGAR|nr:hypothetical protein D9757_010051 [Collybiopsis confluens]
MAQHVSGPPHFHPRAPISTSITGSRPIGSEGESVDGGVSSSAHRTHPQSSAPRRPHSNLKPPSSVVTTSLVQTTRLPTGQKMINQYVMDAKVGSGQHGNVWRCFENKYAYVDGSERVLAMKIVKRDSPKAKRERQYKMLRGKLGNGAGLTGAGGGGGSGSGGGNSAGTGAGFGGGLGSTRRTQPTVVDGILTTEQNIRKEIAIMKKCRHPHVVRLYEVIDDRKNAMVFMVMEYLGGGEIQYTNPTNPGTPVLTVEQTRRVMRDAILGLEYLHHQGIIHRDIKPANLLWSTGHERVKIADFGTAHFSYAQRLAAAKASNSPTLPTEAEDEEDPLLLNEAALAKRAGTPAFLAPEIVWEWLEWPKSRRFYPSFSTPPTLPFPPSSESRCKPRTTSDGEEAAEVVTVVYPPPSSPPVTKSIDIWALGVTLYCLLFGKIPFVPPDPTTSTSSSASELGLDTSKGEGKGEENEAQPVAVTEWTGYSYVCNKNWRAEKTMGRDGVRTGGRHPKEQSDSEGDNAHGREGVLVMHLLDHLLQKDLETRITLEEVKMHPWFLHDLPNPDYWLRMTSPNEPSSPVEAGAGEGEGTGGAYPLPPASSEVSFSADDSPFPEEMPNASPVEQSYTVGSSYSTTPRTLDSAAISSDGSLSSSSGSFSSSSFVEDKVPSSTLAPFSGTETARVGGGEVRVMPTSPASPTTTTTMAHGESIFVSVGGEGEHLDEIDDMGAIASLTKIEKIQVSEKERDDAMSVVKFRWKRPGAGAVSGPSGMASGLGVGVGVGVGGIGNARTGRAKGGGDGGNEEVRAQQKGSFSRISHRISKLIKGAVPSRSRTGTLHREGDERRVISTQSTYLDSKGFSAGGECWKKARWGRGRRSRAEKDLGDRGQVRSDPDMRLTSKRREARAERERARREGGADAVAKEDKERKARAKERQKLEQDVAQTTGVNVGGRQGKESHSAKAAYSAPDRMLKREADNERTPRTGTQQLPSASTPVTPRSRDKGKRKAEQDVVDRPSTSSSRSRFLSRRSISRSRSPAFSQTRSRNATPTSDAGGGQVTPTLTATTNHTNPNLSPMGKILSTFSSGWKRSESVVSLGLGLNYGHNRSFSSVSALRQTSPITLVTGQSLSAPGSGAGSPASAPSASSMLSIHVPSSMRHTSPGRSSTSPAPSGTISPPTSAVSPSSRRPRPAHAFTQPSSTSFAPGEPSGAGRDRSQSRFYVDSSDEDYQSDDDISFLSDDILSGGEDIRSVRRTSSWDHRRRRHVEPGTSAEHRGHHPPELDLLQPEPYSPISPISFSATGEGIGSLRAQYHRGRSFEQDYDDENDEELDSPSVAFDFSPRVRGQVAFSDGDVEDARSNLDISDDENSEGRAVGSSDGDMRREGYTAFVYPGGNQKPGGLSPEDEGLMVSFGKRKDRKGTSS